MKVVSSKNIVHIIRRTLNLVDPRLVGHGERAAFIVWEMLRRDPQISKQERINLCMLVLLHDIGAYKTEDIDRMVDFESRNIWEHSVYGYVFLKNMSPLSPYAEAILFHHLPYSQYEAMGIRDPENHYAGLINLADRIDTALLRTDPQFIQEYVTKNRGVRFSPRWADLFLEAERESLLLERLCDGTFFQDFESFTEDADFSSEEKNQFLSMVAYSLDFRSEFMVLHTVTTVSVSRIIAELMGLSQQEQEQIYYGALLHDVGKVATPVEILEKPASLTPMEMDIMKRHVCVTAEILGDYLDSVVKRIAVRHHEKIDGSGYPEGLMGGSLTIGERVVAVADIVSALVRKRSYKEAFDSHTTKKILSDLRDSNKICPLVTNVVLENFDKIIATSKTYGQELLDIYRSMKDTYENILSKLPENLREGKGV